jgi:hypothetical protein
MNGSEIKGDEIGGTCSKRGDTIIRDRIRVLNKKRGLDAGGIILNQVAKKQSVKIWHGFSWLTEGPGG